jgi:hypothetical protein
MWRWRGRRKKTAAGDDDLPPMPLRRRLLIAALAVAVAWAIMLLLIYRPGDPKRGLPFAAQPAAVEDKSRVGGKADVIIVAPAASR